MNLYCKLMQRESIRSGVRSRRSHHHPNVLIFYALKIPTHMYAPFELPISQFKYQRAIFPIDAVHNPSIGYYVLRLRWWFSTVGFVLHRREKPAELNKITIRECKRNRKIYNAISISSTVQIRSETLQRSVRGWNILIFHLLLSHTCLLVVDIAGFQQSTIRAWKFEDMRVPESWIGLEQMLLWWPHSRNLYLSI